MNLEIKKVIKNIKFNEFKNIFNSNVNCYDFLKNILVICKDYEINIYEYKRTSFELKSKKIINSDVINNVLIKNHIFVTFGKNFYIYDLNLKEIHYHFTNYPIIDKIMTVNDNIILITSNKINIYQIMETELIWIKILISHNYDINFSLNFLDNYLITVDNNLITNFTKLDLIDFNLEYEYLNFSNPIIKIVTIKKFLITFCEKNITLNHYLIKFNKNKIIEMEFIKKIKFFNNIENIFSNQKFLFISNNKNLYVYVFVLNEERLILNLELNQIFENFKINEYTNQIFLINNNLLNILSSETKLNNKELLIKSGLYDKINEEKINMKLKILKEENKYYEQKIKENINLKEKYLTSNSEILYKEKKENLNLILNDISFVKIDYLKKIKNNSNKIDKFHDKKYDLFNKNNLCLKTIKLLLEEHYEIIN